MERVLFAPRAQTPLGPDVASDPGPYSLWVARREEERCASGLGAHRGPPLHLIMVIVGEPPQETVPTLRSLQDQAAGSWSLTVVLPAPFHASFTALLTVSGLHRSTQRVHVLPVDEPGPSGVLFSHGVAANPGANIALIFPGDIWAPDAVALLSSNLMATGVTYADEDVRSQDGRHVDPRLKPAYSPDFLLTSSYVGRPLAIGSVIAAGLPDELGGHESSAFEHDIALRCCESAETVTHLAEVLCHRLATSIVTPNDNGRQQVVAALDRRGERAEVAPGPVAGTHAVRRTAPSGVRVSIIIPFRDEPQLLRTCIESIGSTTHEQVEFVLIDNGSTQPETATLLERLGSRPDTQIVADDRPFNWAALNNAGVRLAQGDVLLFLNNDVEACHSGWLSALCAQAVRPDVAAVGARLLYPGGLLQHCGIVVGLCGAAGHPLAGLSASQPGYLNMSVVARECAAVTGACLATRRDVFEQLQGFDESLGVDLNDVDYCLRAQVAGYRILFEPGAELIHYESPSRGTAGDVRDVVHFLHRWKDSLELGDPFLNEHLTRRSPSCGLRESDEKEWWNQWFSSLTAP